MRGINMENISRIREMAVYCILELRKAEMYPGESDRL